MNLLAIDTSCDDSCVAIIETDSFRLLADTVYSHTVAMKSFGGIVPEIASREHLKALPLALENALREAGLQLSMIHHICVTHRPGLIGSLLVGVSYAKALAYSLQIPFSVLDHIEGHLFSPYLCQTEKLSVPPHPWLALVVSGGHTELFRVTEPLIYTWLGGTLDDAAGEAFDKVGKLMGLDYPAGPRIDQWVREEAQESDRIRYSLPRAQTEGFSFSFSGLKTAAALIVKRSDFKDGDKLSLAASCQEAIIDSLVLKLRSAQNQFPHHHLVVTGGVAGNSRLRQILNDAYFPKPRHCSDNAAMIACLGALRLKHNKLANAPWDATATAKCT